MHNGRGRYSNVVLFVKSLINFREEFPMGCFSHPFRLQSVTVTMFLAMHTVESKNTTEISAFLIAKVFFFHTGAKITIG